MCTASHVVVHMCVLMLVMHVSRTEVSSVCPLGVASIDCDWEADLGVVCGEGGWVLRIAMFEIRR